MAFSTGATPISISTKLHLRSDWAGFDLVRMGGQLPMIYRRGDLAIITGCITTASPMKNQAGWYLTVAEFDPRSAPSRDVAFLAPTMLSRYEGIYQCGTSTMLRGDGKLQILFSKNANPMVLHFSGICFNVSGDEPTEINIANYDLREWMQQTKSRSLDARGPDDKVAAVGVDDLDKPSVLRSGDIVCLQGKLREATYGFLSQHIGTLPEGLRPLREIRCLASLLQEAETGAGPSVSNSVAVTLRPNGEITVQGGKVHMIDQKGNMRVMQQNKKGCLCLDGIRFSLKDGQPLQLAAHLASPGATRAAAAKSKLKHLLSVGDGEASTGVCIKEEGDVVMLEGYLSWTTARPPNKKQPLLTLPKGCWPPWRLVFFTRGSEDHEERRRVDIDQYGRVFCPEGAPDGRVELTGVIFVAAEHQGPPPKEPEWDDLKVQYHTNEGSLVSTSFDGHELLEQFVRRSNHHEWKLIAFDFDRHSGRKMLMPLGEARLRGRDRGNPMDLNKREEDVWRANSRLLGQHFGVTTFQTLMHLSDEVFDKVVRQIQMAEDDRGYLREQRRKQRLERSAKRQPGLTYSFLSGLASEIVDQMFEHWDFKAQLQGGLQNDHRPPQTIEHLFPRKYGADRFVSKKLKSDEDMEKFEKARQFFYLYETTGTNMTHCSLLGASDTFTTTGKWFFPDDPQTQQELFNHIAWLFPKEIYLYISERQTSRFPFIEDLDIQCKTDWDGVPADGGHGIPPDRLLMNKPYRENGQVCGDPGELMRKRAQAVHMIYPQFDHLEVLVYSASGYNKGKDMLKSSFHLVWPQLIVDADRAPVIRHVTLGRFRNETNTPGSFLDNLQRKLLELHESNNWELVFDSTTINARNGLRLPYSDKASMVISTEEEKRKVKAGEMSKNSAKKSRVREGRPSKAIGRIRFEFEKDPLSPGSSTLKSAQWDADVDSFTISEWIKMGSCRREVSRVDLTPWQLQQDVLEMLPTKPGERFTFEGEADGEGGHWVTHKPLEKIRRCDLNISDFVGYFNEALSDEQAQLEEEGNTELLFRLFGSWVSVTSKQAIWRGSAAVQCDTNDPNRLWGRQQWAGGAARPMRRPAELIYVKAKGKIIVDGPKEVVEKLLIVLRPFTKQDDVAVTPIYDVNKISL